MSHSGNLPADPDQMNGQRAEWAMQAIERFESRTGCDRDESLGDLLADLMHWCDRYGQDFEYALTRSRRNYLDETGGRSTPDQRSPSNNRGA